MVEKIINEISIWSEFEDLNKSYTVKEILDILNAQHNKECLEIILGELK